MPGQPDWQRYQSSVGPPLLNLQNVGPQTTGVLYAGQWQSYWAFITSAQPGGVWTITITWWADAAGTVGIRSDQIIIGNSKGRVGWRPAVSPWFTVQILQTVFVANDNVTVQIVPSLVGALTGGRWTQDDLISVFEQSMNHNQFTTLDGAYIISGPAVLTLRANMFNVTFDLEALGQGGVWADLRRFVIGDYDTTKQYGITLPEQPVRIKVTNNETHAAVLFDVGLVPA